MEMKVWVEDVVRVVCGITQTTTCQDVVISLAQAIGQTGRYILILNLRGKERQLGANEHPLKHLNKLGQLAAEVQFILRRTGPSLSGGQDTTSRIIHPALLKSQESESLPHREPEKTHTFTLGTPTVSRGTKYNQANKTSSSSKEEIFKQILKHQRTLKDLQLRLKEVQNESEWWERETSSVTITGRNLGYAEELEKIKQWFENNEAELMQSQLWRERLQEQIDREEELESGLHQIKTSVLDHTYRIEELLDHSSYLEHNIELETSQVDAQHSEVVLRTLKWEISRRTQEREELDYTLSKTLKKLQTTEDALRSKWETIEDLKKELRQCNLQHFIQQTSCAPLVDHTTSLPVTEALLSNAGIMGCD